MYIFAEPVTEEQVAEIQSHNEAKIKEFERKLFGLTSDEAGSQETEEDDSKWENIQADVRETMDKDELSIEEADGEDVEYDASENARVASNERGTSGEDDLYGIREEAREGDGATAAAAENEDDEDDELVDSEEDEEADGEKLEESIDEADEEQDLDEESLEETEDDNEGESEELQEASESEGQKDLKGNDGEKETGEEERTGIDQEDSQADDQSASAADKDQARGQGNKELQTEGNEQERPSASSADFPIKADKAFLNKVTEELSYADPAASQNPDILAMTLTIRNKVNGKFVLRPEHLTAGDKWSIEYSLTEVDTKTRARALYKACQARRKKKHDKMETKNDEERLTGFLRRLRELSMEGRKWRARQDKEDTKKPMQILGDAIGERSGEGDGGKRKSDD